MEINELLKQISYEQKKEFLNYLIALANQDQKITVGDIYE